jgi:hypothetical protein
MKSLVLTASSLLVLSGLVACTAASSDAVGSSEQHATTDIDHMFRRPDGKFDVWCADGTTESGLTAEEINMNLACGGPHTTPGSSSSSGGSPAVDAGPATPASCLSLTPIDATAFPYKKANAKVPGACTAQDVSNLSAYYRAHAGDADFTTATWASSVSPACAQCVFTADETAAPATTWGPIITADQQLQSVNRGGCIEIVSGSEACGRSYQQFQDCTVQACLVDCTTQSDFTACRQDARVLDTSCKNAFEAVKHDCDETKIGQYETACKGTTFTFEGPIKVACSNP